MQSTSSGLRRSTSQKDDHSARTVVKGVVTHDCSTCTDTHSKHHGGDGRQSGGQVGPLCVRGRSISCGVIHALPTSLLLGMVKKAVGSGTPGDVLTMPSLRWSVCRSIIIISRSQPSKAPHGHGPGILPQGSLEKVLVLCVHLGALTLALTKYSGRYLSTDRFPSSVSISFVCPPDPNTTTVEAGLVRTLFLCPRQEREPGEAVVRIRVPGLAGKGSPHPHSLLVSWEGLDPGGRARA